MGPETSRDGGVARTLVAYEKDPGDTLVGEWPLRDISLAELQALFSRPPEDPMYYCYAAGPRPAACLSRTTPLRGLARGIRFHAANEATNTDFGKGEQI